MTGVLQLVAIVLPSAFPPDAVPDRCARFVRECVPGLTRRQLIAKTRALGFNPGWDALPGLAHDDIVAFRFCLSVDGAEVPLIARMRCAAKPARPVKLPERDLRQLDLF
jgi:hypothetical protein